MNPPKGAPRRNSTILLTLKYLVGGLTAALFVFPAAWTVLRSLQTEKAAAEGLTWRGITSLTTQNYTAIAEVGPGLWVYVANSAFLGVATMVLTVVVATLAGYGFARLKFAGSMALFLLVLTPFLVPFQTILTPLFSVLDFLGLLNSLPGLVLIYTTFQLPFATFLMRNSFEAVPREIEEAALLDGLGVFGMLTRVLWPMVLPGAATVALYAFLFGWNEFLAALVFLTSPTRFTLPIALANIQTGLYGTLDMGVLNAGATLATLPCLLLFVVLQRYYVRGLTAGAVKG